MTGVCVVFSFSTVCQLTTKADNWGFADVEAAVGSIPGWIELVGWQGPGVDINRWIVSGHSNGGQGTWYALTHRPDKVLAAAPVSGYASIQSKIHSRYMRTDWLTSRRIRSL